MRVIYRKIRHARYLYIKRNVEKVWGARYILGARYLSKNTVIYLFVYLLFGIATRNFTLRVLPLCFLNYSPLFPELFPSMS